MGFEFTPRFVISTITDFISETVEHIAEDGSVSRSNVLRPVVETVQDFVMDAVWKADEEPPADLSHEEEVEAGEVEVSSLATEVYQDEENANCLDFAVETLAELERQGVDISQLDVVILANVDPALPGHVGLLGPDGTFYDQDGEHDYAEYRAEHPELKPLLDDDGELPSGDVVLDAMNHPPGPARDAALADAGLADLANTPVAFPGLLLLGVVAVAALVLTGCGGGTDGSQAILDGLTNGDTSDAFRDSIAREFAARDMAGDEALMTEIRNAGLLDEFLDATLRDPNGDPVDPAVRAAAQTMLESGRLGFFGETFASTGIAVFSPSAGVASPSGSTDSHYVSGNVYLNTDIITTMHRTLTHELFHAFSDAHGRNGSSSLDEGFGISIIDYAFSGGTYDVAERVYGTANFKRDEGTTGFALGSTAGYDASLLEVMTAIAARDHSGLAWTDDAQLLSDYQTYFEPLARFTDSDGDGTADWSQVGHADSYYTARDQMLTDRAASP